MTAVFDALHRARAHGARVVLVTVVGVRGPASSEPGAKLVSDGQGVLAGTLGCSELDNAGVAVAADALVGGAVLRRTVSQAEGRSVELFAEVQEPQAAVVVFGSTPIGRAVADLGRFLGRRGVLVAPGGDTAAPAGVEVKADDPGRYLLAAPPGAGDAVVVSDHDAPWVDEVLRISLASEAFYVAMLGSRSHAPEVVRRLEAAGVPSAHLGRLRTPAGLDIGSRTSEEIALAIVAELVTVERGRAGGFLSSPPST